MALMFLDSFDHYDDLTIKWSANITALIDLTGTKSRTGIGACSCFPFGPTLNFTSRTSLVMGTAYMATSFGNDVYGVISATIRQVRCHVNGDGSLSIQTSNDPFPIVLGTSAPNVIQLNVYAYIEMKISAFSGAGTVNLKVNGQTVLTVIGNTNPAATGTAESWYLQGPGGGNFGYHDDVYLCDLTNSGIVGAPNNDFLGPIRNFAQVPIADGGPPLQWVPKTGPTHFTEVDEIPPDDNTSYNGSNTVGDVDQYVYGTTGILPPVQVFGVQVCLDAALDIAGARSIAPNVGGVTGNSVALSTSYDIVKQVYDGNPVSGIAWQLTDFATVQFGPEVTL